MGYKEGVCVGEGGSNMEIERKKERERDIHSGSLQAKADG